jgi:NADH:ubiquinone oxidoreductase subunit 5 (subunit L)/multisubunit Na+/H+ antiporter MnhA subunit
MALGASAYSVAIFHLMTHAFFKAVLFLGAGSVIIALHHEQDMRKMGGLRKYLPITYLTVLIGALANAGFPPFAGFFSKDSIIEALHFSQTPGAGFAYVLALAGVFVGGLYSFRLVFFAFHGKERFELHDDSDHGGHGGHQKPHESSRCFTEATSARRSRPPRRWGEWPRYSMARWPWRSTASPACLSGWPRPASRRHGTATSRARTCRPGSRRASR